MTAKRPDAACSGVAPTAWNPASTIANALAKPVIAARNPDVSGWMSVPPDGAVGEGDMAAPAWAVFLPASGPPGKRHEARLSGVGFSDASPRLPSFDSVWASDFDKPGDYR